MIPAAIILGGCVITACLIVRAARNQSPARGRGRSVPPPRRTSEQRPSAAPPAAPVPDVYPPVNARGGSA